METQTSSSLVQVLKGLDNIDIYVTYRCNLRCKHCFVGELLNEKTDFNQDLLEELLIAASEADIKEITFLGGEPTLYRYISEVINLTYELGMKARIVTNGGQGFSKLMKVLPNSQIPQACLSIDGATEETHDSMRGKGNFEQLKINAIKYKNLGGELSAITSIDKFNCHEVKEIIGLASSLNADYINLHYVSQRGFATSDRVLSINQWKEVIQQIEFASQVYPIPVRFERTFIPVNEYSSMCVVRDKRNIMFFPDGRVYRCAMFVEIPDSHSYIYDINGLHFNKSMYSESNLCKKDDNTLGCPIASKIYGETIDAAEKSSNKIGCIYSKDCISGGIYQRDFRKH